MRRADSLYTSSKYDEQYINTCFLLKVSYHIKRIFDGAADNAHCRHMVTLRLSQWQVLQV